MTKGKSSEVSGGEFSHIPLVHGGCYLRVLCQAW